MNGAVHVLYYLTTVDIFHYYSFANPFHFYLFLLYAGVGTLLKQKYRDTSIKIIGEI